MKQLTQKKEQEIRALEQEGDTFFAKDKFEACLSALSRYVEAQEALYNAANDTAIDNAKPYPFFNSSNVSYKAWYSALSDKISRANTAMADPRLARK